MSPIEQLGRSHTYQQLVTAVTRQRVVHLTYRGANADQLTPRDIEPIGLYLSQQWHMVGFCRLRQAFRNFRLDRIQELTISQDVFTAKSETLSQYWRGEATRQGREKIVISLQPTAVFPEPAQHLHNTKYQYGWGYDQPLPNGQIEMTFFIGSMPYIASWLLPYANAITVLEPIELKQALRQLAQQAYTYFGDLQ